ncbi:succinyldiaminopimelate transaminase [Dermabacteraceae bacterium P13095]
MRSQKAAALPDFPWDALRPYKELAASHPGGLVDLSIGTPVDPVPGETRQALAAASDFPGYPLTIGTPRLRAALVAFLERNMAAQGLSEDQVLPTVGSKELVAHLPFQLGIGPGDKVAFPEVAYPTYEIGARLCGAKPLPIDPLTLIKGEADGVKLLWLNSPGNPNGAVLSVSEMRQIVTWAREHAVVVASDECYALLPWEVDEVPSILDPRVNGGSLDNLLCVYSLSKQSNLAGYRSAFIAGDGELIADLREIRRHSGLIMPGPNQAAMAHALADEVTPVRQREIYRRRRDVLVAAIRRAGGRIDDSVAGLYLWTTWGEDCWESVQRLAKLGIICAPGIFYGNAGANHVRIAITATDVQVDAAAQRLLSL